MNGIEYINLSDVNHKDIMLLLNKTRIRTHLIDHALFEENSLKEWLVGKMMADACAGCKVRAIMVDNKLAGWCGIQLEDDKYELAIVLDESYWGLGKQIFIEMITWAKVFGHQTVYIHFLHTRPAYRFLRNIAKNVDNSELLGDKFTTYELEVDKIISLLT